MAMDERDVQFGKHLEDGRRRGSFAYALRALGRGRLPQTLNLPGGPWQHLRTVKHDFFAATGFYAGPSGKLAVLKMGRTAPFMGLSLRFIGRYLCRREMRFYRRLSDLPNVPPVLGQIGDTGFVHAFVPGRPLQKGKPVPDGFFDQLQRLTEELHRRFIAYVDTNKPENILLGDDGRPHLIDFQISWDLHELGDNPLNRWILHRLQREDIYHLAKHKKRLRPDELQPGELELATRQSALIRLHRLVTRPYFILRRGTMRLLHRRGHLLPEGSK